MSSHVSLLTLPCFYCYRQTQQLFLIYALTWYTSFPLPTILAGIGSGGKEYRTLSLSGHMDGYGCRNRELNAVFASCHYWYLYTVQTWTHIVGNRLNPCSDNFSAFFPLLLPSQQHPQWWWTIHRVIFLVSPPFSDYMHPTSGSLFKKIGVTYCYSIKLQCYANGWCF